MNRIKQFKTSIVNYFVTQIGRLLKLIEGIRLNIWMRFHTSLYNTEGIGVVEVILILVVLIGLVLIFKSQLTELVEDIFDTITSESSTV